jgi:hypothetical protein
MAWWDYIDQQAGNDLEAQRFMQTFQRQIQQRQQRQQQYQEQRAREDDNKGIMGALGGIGKSIVGAGGDVITTVAGKGVEGLDWYDRNVVANVWNNGMGEFVAGFSGREWDDDMRYENLEGWGKFGAGMAADPLSWLPVGAAATHGLKAAAHGTRLARGAGFVDDAVRVADRIANLPGEGIIKGVGLGLRPVGAGARGVGRAVQATDLGADIFRTLGRPTTPFLAKSQSNMAAAALTRVAQNHADATGIRLEEMTGNDMMGLVKGLRDKQDMARAMTREAMKETDPTKRAELLSQVPKFTLSENTALEAFSGGPGYRDVSKRLAEHFRRIATSQAKIVVPGGIDLNYVDEVVRGVSTGALDSKVATARLAEHMGNPTLATDILTNGIGDDRSRALHNMLEEWAINRGDNVMDRMVGDASTMDAKGVIGALRQAVEGQVQRDVGDATKAARAYMEQVRFGPVKMQPGAWLNEDWDPFYDKWWRGRVEKYIINPFQQLVLGYAFFPLSNALEESMQNVVGGNLNYRMWSQSADEFLALYNRLGPSFQLPGSALEGLNDGDSLARAIYGSADNNMLSQLGAEKIEGGRFNLPDKGVKGWLAGGAALKLSNRLSGNMRRGYIMSRINQSLASDFPELTLDPKVMKTLTKYGWDNRIGQEMKLGLMMMSDGSHTADEVAQHLFRNWSGPHQEIKRFQSLVENTNFHPKSKTFLQNNAAALANPKTRANTIAHAWELHLQELTNQIDNMPGVLEEFADDVIARAGKVSDADELASSLTQLDDARVVLNRLYQSSRKEAARIQESMAEKSLNSKRLFDNERRFEALSNKLNEAHEALVRDLSSAGKLTKEGTEALTQQRTLIKAKTAKTKQMWAKIRAVDDRFLRNRALEKQSPDTVLKWRDARERIFDEFEMEIRAFDDELSQLYMKESWFPMGQKAQRAEDAANAWVKAFGVPTEVQPQVKQAILDGDDLSQFLGDENAVQLSLFPIGPQSGGGVLLPQQHGPGNVGNAGGTAGPKVPTGTNAPAPAGTPGQTRFDRYEEAAVEDYKAMLPGIMERAQGATPPPTAPPPRVPPPPRQSREVWDPSAPLSQEDQLEAKKFASSFTPGRQKKPSELVKMAVDNPGFSRAINIETGLSVHTRKQFYALDSADREAWVNAAQDILETDPKLENIDDFVRYNEMGRQMTGSDIDMAETALPADGSSEVKTKHWRDLTPEERARFARKTNPDDPSGGQSRLPEDQKPVEGFTPGQRHMRVVLGDNAGDELYFTRNPQTGEVEYRNTLLEEFEAGKFGKDNGGAFLNEEKVSVEEFQEQLWNDFKDLTAKADPTKPEQELIRDYIEKNLDSTERRIFKDFLMRGDKSTPTPARELPANDTRSASQVMKDKKKVRVYHGTTGDLDGDIRPDSFVTTDRKVAETFAKAEARLNGGDPRVIEFDADPDALKAVPSDDFAARYGNAQLVNDPTGLTRVDPDAMAYSPHEKPEFPRNTEQDLLQALHIEEQAQAMARSGVPIDRARAALWEEGALRKMFEDFSQSQEFLTKYHSIFAGRASSAVTDKMAPFYDDASKTMRAFIHEVETAGTVDAIPAELKDALFEASQSFMKQTSRMDMAATNKTLKNAWSAALNDYHKYFTNYDDGKTLHTVMRHIFPFWRYEYQRFPRLARSAARAPGLVTNYHRFIQATEDGNISLPGGLRVNPFGGTLYNSMRDLLRDGGYYFNDHGGFWQQANELMKVTGFIPGPMISGPDAAFSGTPGDQIPTAIRAPLQLAEGAGIPAAGDVLRRFPSRFQQYAVNQELADMGIHPYEATPEQIQEAQRKASLAAGISGATGYVVNTGSTFNRDASKAQREAALEAGVPEDAVKDAQRRHSNPMYSTGEDGTRYLNTAELRELNDAHPEWGRLAAVRDSFKDPVGRQAEKDKYAGQQAIKSMEGEAEERLRPVYEAFRRGEIDGKELLKERANVMAEIRGAKKAYDKAHPRTQDQDVTKVPREDLLAQAFYDIEPTTGMDGMPDWDSADRLKAQFLRDNRVTEDEFKYITETYPKKKFKDPEMNEVESEYRTASEQRKKYFSLPKYGGLNEAETAAADKGMQYLTQIKQGRPNLTTAQALAVLARIDPSIAQATRKALTYRTKVSKSRERGVEIDQRKQYAQSNPLLSRYYGID